MFLSCPGVLDLEYWSARDSVFTEGGCNYINPRARSYISPTLLYLTFPTKGNFLSPHTHRARYVPQTQKMTCKMRKCIYSQSGPAAAHCVLTLIMLLAPIA